MRRLRLVQDKANDLAIALGKVSGPGNREIIERARAAISAGHHAMRAAAKDTASYRLASRLKTVGREVERAIRANDGTLPSGETGARTARLTSDEIRRDAKAAADDREGERTREIRRGIAEWCREAEANGASRAHRWTQLPTAWRPEVVEQRIGEVTTATTNPDEVIKHERSKCEAYWAPKDAEQALPDWGTVPALPRPSVERVRAAARRFRRDTGQSADHFSPRDIG